MKDRTKTFTHDLTFVLGVLHIVFWVLVTTGEVKGIMSWYNSEKSFAFNVEGRDYIAKK